MNIQQVLDDKGGRPITVGPEAAILDVARTMAARKIGLVMVCAAGGRLLGVVSERDIVRMVAEDLAGLATMQAKDVMVSNVVTCSPDDTIRDVMEAMHNRGFRHMPVVRFGNLLGLVSSRDLLKRMLSEAELHQRAAAWSDISYI